MDTPTPAPEASVPSLRELRERHLALLREWSQRDRSAPPDPKQAEELRAAARALGAWLEDYENRDRAQGIIDYWTAALTSMSRGSLPELVRLEDFDEARAQDQADRDEEIVNAHAETPELEKQINDLLLCLIRAGPNDTVLCRSPAERADLQPAKATPETSAKLDRMLDELVEAGALRRIPGDSADQDRFEIKHPSVARRCKRLQRLIKEGGYDDETRARLIATAQLWNEKQRHAGYLLRGSTLDEAGKYAADDPLLGDFVRASRRSEMRWKLIVSGGLVAAVLLGFGLWWFGNTRGWNLGQAAGYDTGLLLASEAPNALEDTKPRIEFANSPGPAPTLATTAAVIWVGNARQRLVRDVRSGELVNPSDLRPGRRYRLATGLLLHSAFPLGSAEDAPIGTAPKGALVVAHGPGRPFRRESGDQHWLAVRLIPRVRITYAAGRQDADSVIQPFIARLERSGFDVVRVDPGEVSQNRVYYAREQDRTVAARLFSHTATGLQGQDGAPVALTCSFAADRLAPIADFGLALDLNALRIAPAPATPASGGSACAQSAK